MLLFITLLLICCNWTGSIFILIKEKLYTEMAKATIVAVCFFLTARKQLQLSPKHPSDCQPFLLLCFSILGLRRLENSTVWGACGAISFMVGLQTAHKGGTHESCCYTHRSNDNCATRSHFLLKFVLVKKKKKYNSGMFVWKYLWRERNVEHWAVKCKKLNMIKVCLCFIKLNVWLLDITYTIVFVTLNMEV